MGTFNGYEMQVDVETLRPQWLKLLAPRVEDGELGYLVWEQQVRRIVEYVRAAHPHVDPEAINLSTLMEWLPAEYGGASGVVMPRPELKAGPGERIVHTPFGDKIMPVEDAQKG